MYRLSLGTSAPCVLMILPWCAVQPPPSWVNLPKFWSWSMLRVTSFPSSLHWHLMNRSGFSNTHWNVHTLIPSLLKPQLKALSTRCMTSLERFSLRLCNSAEVESYGKYQSVFFWHLNANIYITVGLCSSPGCGSWRQHCHSVASRGSGSSGNAHPAAGSRGQVLEGSLHGCRQILWCKHNYAC